MLRRALVTTGGIILAGALLTPTAAQAADRASMGAVTLAWSDGNRTMVRIDWTETAPMANVISLERNGVRTELGVTTTAAPNQLLVTPAELEPNGDASDAARIVVEDPAGVEVHSVDFDRYLRTAPEPTLSFAAANAIRWTIPPDTSVDTTPGDPLDVPGSTRYLVRLDLNELPYGDFQCKTVALPSTTEPTGVIANRDKPYLMFLSIANEWQPAGGYRVSADVRTTKLTLTSPTVTPYGTTLTLSGTVSTGSIFSRGMPPACHEISEPGTVGPLVLHARATSTSPWYVVGTTLDVDGKYTFKVTNPGARQYRVVVPGQAGLYAARYGAATAARLVHATTRIVSAKFITPVINFGTKPQAYLRVEPPGSQRAALQYRAANGSWQGVAYKSLYAGRGLLVFPWSRRGATAFRWWVPGSNTSTGLKVDPIYSGVFTLTVR